jgi:hypothetical protein
LFIFDPWSLPIEVRSSPVMTLSLDADGREGHFKIGQ